MTRYLPIALALSLLPAAAQAELVTFRTDLLEAPVYTNSTGSYYGVGTPSGTTVDFQGSPSGAQITLFSATSAAYSPTPVGDAGSTTGTLKINLHVNDKLAQLDVNYVLLASPVRTSFTLTFPGFQAVTVAFPELNYNIRIIVAPGDARTALAEFTRINPVVPEPSSLAMAGSAVAMIGVVARRRQTTMAKSPKA